MTFELNYHTQIETKFFEADFKYDIGDLMFLTKILRTAIKIIIEGSN